MTKPWSAKPSKGRRYWKAKEPQNFCWHADCLIRTNSPLGVRDCPEHGARPPLSEAQPHGSGVSASCPSLSADFPRGGA